jgi:hypothetical protein
MANTLRDVRLANEWDLLLELCESNCGTLGTPEREFHGDGDEFRLVVRATGGLRKEDGRLLLVQEHAVRFRYPRFFPAVSADGFLDLPLFHPNVDPETGFVCLFDRFSAGDTIVSAVVRMQRVISWVSFNPRAEHLLQPSALAWHAEPGREWHLPLPAVPVVPPHRFQLDRVANVRSPSARCRICTE